MIPFPPQMTGDLAQDMQLIVKHLYDLNRYLSEGEPDQGWSSSGFIVDKTLTSGDTLVQTQNVISTIIDVLKSKGILGS